MPATEARAAISSEEEAATKWYTQMVQHDNAKCNIAHAWMSLPHISFAHFNTSLPCRSCSVFNPKSRRSKVKHMLHSMHGIYLREEIRRTDDGLSLPLISYMNRNVRKRTYRTNVPEKSQRTCSFVFGLIKWATEVWATGICMRARLLSLLRANWRQYYFFVCASARATQYRWAGICSTVCEQYMKMTRIIK